MIISLYSYKGGTGRSLLCANLAAYFYEQGLKVLLWEWDLDAPGLHYFFNLGNKDIHQSGTLEMLETFMNEGEMDFSTFNAQYIQNLRPATGKKGKIDWISGGNYNNAYANRANKFDWNKFVTLGGSAYIDSIRAWLLTQGYDFILLDSRTGITDYSGFCTIQLPDICLLTITPHHQSYDGNIRMMQNIEKSKFLESQGRTPLFLPILSRLNVTVDDDANAEMVNFKERFSEYCNNFFNRIGGRVQERYAGKERNYINETVLKYEVTLAHYENLVFPIDKENKERIYVGYPEKVAAIATILRESKHSTKASNPYSTNIRYRDITNKSVVIGSTHYNVETDFQHCMLWIQIQKVAQSHSYTLQVTLKTNYIGVNPLGQEGESLLSQSIRVKIPEKILPLYTNIAPSAFYTWGEPQLEHLFTLFFAGDIGRICTDFIQLLDNYKIRKLLIVLASEDKMMTHLPFERILPAFWVSKTRTFQNISPNLGFARSNLPLVSSFQWATRNLTATPLNILFVAALPDSLAMTLETAFIERIATEQYQLIEALEALCANTTDITIEFLYPASLIEIENALHARQHDIVHISVYSTIQIDDNQPILYLENDKGALQATYGSDLASVLSKYPSVRLLLLSLLKDETTFPNLAIEQIVSTYRIPSLLTTRFIQTEAAHKSFITVFYTQLSKGLPLTEALNQAKIRFQQLLPSENGLSPAVTLYLNEAVGGLVDKAAPRKKVADFAQSNKLIKTTHTRLIGGGFIGRKRYLIQMQELFRRGKHICLYGLGGLGKTTLAEAFVYHFAAQEKAEVFLFKNHEIEESYILDTLKKGLLHVRPKIATKLSAILAAQKSATEKLQTLINNYPKRGRLILLFDNCEFLLQDEADLWQQQIQDTQLSAFLRHLCENAPKHCHVIFTTRYKLKELEDAVTYLALDKMTQGEQERLLNYSEILRNIPVSERPKLYQHLDGHPRSYQLLETLLKKDRYFKWHQLESVENDIFSNLMLRNVYDKLSEKEKSLFKTVCLFITRTPFSVLEGITNQKIKYWWSTLEQLQDWSLLVLEEKSDTFVVHHLTRKWMLDANNNIFTKEEKENNYWAIAKYFVILLDEQDIYDHLIFNNYVLAKEYFELSNLIENDLKDYAKILLQLQHYYQQCGMHQKALDLNLSLLDKKLDKELEGDVCNNIGVIYYTLEQYSDAMPYLNKSLKIREKRGNRVKLAEIKNNISPLYRLEKAYSTALNHLRESLEIRKELADRLGQSITLNNMSQVYIAQVEYRKAKKCLYESLELQKELEDIRLKASTFSNLAYIEYMEGKELDAVKYYEAALGCYEQINDLFGKANTLQDLGSLYFGLENWEKTIECYVKALAILELIGKHDSANQANMIERLKQIALIVGEKEFEQMVYKVRSQNL